MNHWFDYCFAFYRVKALLAAYKTIDMTGFF